ncbi:carboxypeptidase-like regulatory domain-containing protein [Algoriphagus aestuarii]|nr:carboxypeptidase-like regulatory domain-containing protein [Algoriphagus aestuarii]
MRKQLFLWTFFLISCQAWSQNSSIVGTVEDVETADALLRAHIFIPGTTYQTFSDSSGKFNLKGIPPGSWELVAAKDGFKISSVSLKLTGSSQSEANFSLTEKTKLFGDELKNSQRKKLTETWLELMLGSNVNPKELILVNPEVLFFYKDDTGSFWVDFSDVLIVQNLKNGYLISVWLKEPQNLDQMFDPNDLYLSYFEMDFKSEEEINFVQANRIRTYENSLVYVLRELIGGNPEKINLVSTDQDGEFFLEMLSPQEIVEPGIEDKVIAFDGEGILIRKNGVPVYPEQLKTKGFPNEGNQFLQLPFDFNFERSSAIQSIERSANNLQERVFLHTDKDIYLMGENLFFKAYLLVGAPILKAESSKVLHVEILDPSGYSMIHKVFPLENGMASGQISLTPQFNSRDFIVKAYTLWSANYGEDFEYYKPIQVYTGTIEPEEKNVEGSAEGLVLFMDKESYQKEDSVTMNLQVNNAKGAITAANLSVSVIGEESFLDMIPEQNDLVSFARMNPQVGDIAIDSFPFEKEYGFTLKGKILDDNTFLDKSYVELLVDGFLDKRVLKANRDGEFYLDGIQKTGEFSVLIKALSNMGKPLENFELELVRSPNNPNLSKEFFPDLASSSDPLARIDSLQKSFYALREDEILLDEVEVEDKRERDLRSMPFGRPQSVLEMEGVFLTGDTQQFIYSIANRLGLITGGIPPMILNRRGPSAGPPLILLNGAPITGILGPTIGSDPGEEQFRALQAINVFNIERIELIKTIVVAYGDGGRFGVLNIVTKTGINAGSNDRPYQEFKLDGFVDPQPVSDPLYTFPSSTYYWNPEVIINPNQTSAKLKFKLPKNSGSFWVIVNGVNASGEPVAGRFLINRKNLGSN